MSKEQLENSERILIDPSSLDTLMPGDFSGSARAVSGETDEDEEAPNEKDPEKLLHELVGILDNTGLNKKEKVEKFIATMDTGVNGTTLRGKLVGTDKKDMNLWFLFHTCVDKLIDQGLVQQMLDCDKNVIFTRTFELNTPYDKGNRTISTTTTRVHDLKKYVLTYAESKNLPGASLSPYMYNATEARSGELLADNSEVKALHAFLNDYFSTLRGLYRNMNGNSSHDEGLLNQLKSTYFPNGRMATDFIRSSDDISSSKISLESQKEITQASDYIGILYNLKYTKNDKDFMTSMASMFVNTMVVNKKCLDNSDQSIVYEVDCRKYMCARDMKYSFEIPIRMSIKFQNNKFTIENLWVIGDGYINRRTGKFMDQQDLLTDSYVGHRNYVMKAIGQKSKEEPKEQAESIAKFYYSQKITDIDHETIYDRLKDMSAVMNIIVADYPSLRGIFDSNKLTSNTPITRVVPSNKNKNPRN